MQWSPSRNAGSIDSRALEELTEGQFIMDSIILLALMASAALLLVGHIWMVVEEHLTR